MPGLPKMNNLLDLAMDAHGGFENWKKVRLLDVDLEIGGNILLTKFKSPLNRKYACTIEPKNIEVVLNSFPKKDYRGIFKRNDVQIQNGDGKEVDRKQIDRTPLTRQFVWDDLDVLYFLGYAIWNYMLTPFLLRSPGFDVEELSPLKHRKGKIVRRMKVIFPATIPTHCSE